MYHSLLSDVGVLVMCIHFFGDLDLMVLCITFCFLLSCITFHSNSTHFQPIDTHIETNLQMLNNIEEDAVLLSYFKMFAMKSVTAIGLTVLLFLIIALVFPKSSDN